MKQRQDRVPSGLRADPADSWSRGAAEREEATDRAGEGAGGMYNIMVQTPRIVEGNTVLAFFARIAPNNHITLAFLNRLTRSSAGCSHIYFCSAAQNYKASGLHSRPLPCSETSGRRHGAV